ncbi:MAG: DUF1194 domain-containing protein [Xanthobacteraceae bacterium]
MLALLGLAALAACAAAGLAAPALRRADIPAGPADTTVDVELVLAVDVSYSMDPDEQALQRDGYAAALTSPEFVNAVRQGLHGKIVATYIEWAGAAEQKIIVPWRVIADRESAASFADEIANAPYRRAYRTSISGLLQFAAPLFAQSGQRGLRRVIDVSGDGANNHGTPVTIARDEVLAGGVTINGLPIMLKRPSSGTMDIENLDVYYEDCVIGGPAAFVIPIRDRAQFKEAIRTKLVLEVAGRTPRARVTRVSAEAPRISCLIGERLWQRRWGGDSDFN